MPENYLAMFSVPPEDEILEVLGTAPAEMQRAADFIEKIPVLSAPQDLAIG